MLYIFIIFLLITIYQISFKEIKTIDKEALSKDRTTMINGFFVALILFSHFNSYVTFTDKLDITYLKIITKIGQLMVTTFFFYSGYGIFESIKNKKDYMNNFFKRRILKLFISFMIAIILFIIMNLILKYHYSIKTILLSFIGYESIGNSNWFIFATFVMYFITLLSYKLFDKDHGSFLLSTLLGTLMYIIIINKLKNNHTFFNTILCYNFGMYLSYYKDKILLFLENKWHYLLSLLVTLIIMLICELHGYTYMVYEICSISFVYLIFLVTLKIKIGNKILLYLGTNTFTIYILQRIPYIIYKHLGLAKYNIYLYFIVSVLTVLVLSFIFDKLLKKVYKVLKLT